MRLGRTLFLSDWFRREGGLTREEDSVGLERSIDLRSRREESSALRDATRFFGIRVDKMSLYCYLSC